MSRIHNKCPHMDNVVQLSLPELCKIKQGYPCSECDTCGPNLWICLQKNCLHTGCSEQVNDHSTEHFKSNQQHCIHMNLSSQRIWCYLCETEVFFPTQQQQQQQMQSHNRRNSMISNCSSSNSFHLVDSPESSRFFERMYDNRINNGSGGGGCGGESPESSYDEDDGDRRHMDGLVGLQNIANTCYMNAALQALSNSPPLLSYFLQCGDIIEATSELSGNQRKPGLAKSYHRLIKTMWCRNKRSNGYVVPRDILTRIRNVHPMFRGFQQHDTQEFLRCFMDQLHEELKEVTPPPPEYMYKSNNNCNTEQMTIDNDDDIDDQSPCSTPSPSQSEAEYETCDSGVSERSSLSDELQMSVKSTSADHLPSSSPHSTSPSLCQRNSITSSSSKSIPFTSCSTTGSNNSASTIGGSGGSTMMVGQQSQKQQREKSPPKRPHRSIISDVFDGKLLSSVQCLTCNRISTREETFQDLSLPIPGKDHLAVLHQSQGLAVNMNQPQSGVTCTDVVYQVGQDGWFWWIWNWLRSWFWGPAVSLHDCMAAFFSADELKGDNMYSCEKCHKLRNGIKYSRVLELPEMLCVHLKRFRHDLSYSSKISSPVHFPLTGLDMRPYLHKDCKSEVSLYDLTAVICHHGTVGGGHYTSFAKHELTGKWFEFDDQLVTEVTPEIVQTCQAYVLFYRKSNPKMSIIRAHAKELADSNPIQSSDLKFYVSRQWINRFNTFAEPGPIDNYTILCPHGGLPPCKAALSSQLVVPLQQSLWDFLYKQFGGGPICNRLFECDTCRRAAEMLAHRQETELEAFTKFKGEFQNENTPTTIYAISMAWFRQWQLFAEGKTNEDPGPINNTPIAITTTTTTTTDSGITMTSTSVRPGSDYAQLNRKLWKFFHSIYGGGPEIILRGGPVGEDEDEEVEVITQFNKDNESEVMEIDQDQSNRDDVLTENQKNDDYTKFNNVAVDSFCNLVAAPPSSSSTIASNSNNSNEVNNAGTSVGGQLKISKNVSFEDEVADNHQQQQQQQQHFYDAMLKGLKEQELKKKLKQGHYTNLRLTKEESEILSKFCEKLELKDSFGLEGKYNIKNQIHQQQSDNQQQQHIVDSPSMSTMSTTTQQKILTTINHDDITHNSTNSLLTITDPLNDSSNSNSNYPKIQNSQQVTTTLTSSAVKSQNHSHHHHHHQQQQLHHSATMPPPTTKMMNSSSKRKIAEVTPLINYQPFQAPATTTKVELKSYRKVDTTSISPQRQQQQQQDMSSILQSTDLKALTSEKHQNVEQQKHQHKSTKGSSNLSFKQSTRERRRNLTRKSNKQFKTSSASAVCSASDPNNSDSG